MLPLSLAPGFRGRFCPLCWVSTIATDAVDIDASLLLLLSPLSEKHPVGVHDELEWKYVLTRLKGCADTFLLPLASVIESIAIFGLSYDYHLTVCSPVGHIGLVRSSQTFSDISLQNPK